MWNRKSHNGVNSASFPARNVSTHTPIAWAEDQEEGIAALSQICIVAPDHSACEFRNASGNAPVSANVNLPWPSFNSTATCLCCQAVLTTTSSASSPFTSFATICSPPAGAVTPKICAAPTASCNRIEYCVLLAELLFWISTVARSGFRSPSKSAIAKVELNPAEELGECRAGLLAALAHPAAPTANREPRGPARGPFDRRDSHGFEGS